MADPKEETPKEEAKAEEKPKVTAKAEETPKDAAKADDKPEEAAAAKEEAPDAEMKDAEATEEKAEEEETKPKEPEKPKELEEDAPEDSRPKVPVGSVAVSATDSLMNVLPTANGRLLMTITEGGFQYLLAGARATVGLKAGRYMFEVKIVETHERREPAARDVGNKSANGPKQLVRIGLSLGRSSLILGDGSADSVCIDSEGFLQVGKTKSKVSQKFGRDETVALLVNLDPASPNANTISLFKDGKRICDPKPIPEALVGKPLYPHVAYKGVTLQANFGPSPLAPLPFKCRTLATAAGADVEVAPVVDTSASEVVFPVGLPEQGYFDWVDGFLEQNPHYQELSDRMILDWAAKSGLWKPKNQHGSLDEPEMRFGLPMMDDLSVQRLLSHIAPLAQRSFVIPELKANLLEEERKKSLAKFSGFKKTAMVFVGEPDAEYKARVQRLLLEDKVSKAEAEKKRKEAAEERRRAMEEKRKKTEEARQARIAAKKGAEEKGDADEEAKEPAAAEDEKKQDEPDAAVELTEEEKALVHRKFAVPDLTDAVLSKAYAGFSLPTREEGFDDIVFKWQPEAAARTVVKDWIFAKKLTQRVEDLQPGTSFKEAWGEWTKSIQSWRKLQSEWKDPTKRKALLAKRVEAKKKAFEEKKKEAEEKGEEAPKEEGFEPMEIDVEELDVFAVEDVTDIGSGEPLFANFAFEDWALLAIRYELHLLLHSFKKDLDDPDRPSFLEKDLGFYYNKYFRKSFALKAFAVDRFEAFVDLVKDTVSVGKERGFLEAVLGDDTPSANFVKLAEDHRRERQRRLDAGDETAELKFPRNSPQPPGRGPSSGAATGSRYGPSGAAVGRAIPSSGYRSGPPPRQGGGGYGGGGGGARGSAGASRGPPYGGGGGGAPRAPYGAANKRPYSPPRGGGGYGGPTKYPRSGGGGGYGGGAGGGYGGGYRR